MCSRTSTTCSGGTILWLSFLLKKTDQDGVDKSTPWHIHANPNDPAICPVHALSIYLFTNPHLFNSVSKLFPGDSQYRHYTNILMKRIEEHQEDLSTFGSVANLGSHSIRKGSASFAASGSTVSPSIVSICMRAGWTISGAKERYLKFENAGDAFVSRIGSGNNPTSHEFAISPAYFELQDEGDEAVIGLFMNEMFGDVMEDEVAGMLRMMMASVCYHHNWFVQKMHPNNPFRSSVLFNNLTPNITSLAVTCFPWNKTDRTPTFTGIPPHVAILNMLEGLRQGQAKLTADIVQELVKELDERGTFGGFNANRMRDIMDQAIGGVRDEIRSLRVRADEVEANVEGGGNGGGGARVRPTLHHWGGRLHMLPENWHMPKGMNLKAFFHLWFLGSATEGVPPFALIKDGKELDHFTKRGRKVLADMKYLVTKAVRAVENQNQAHLLVDDLWSWDVPRVNAFYHAVKDRFKFYNHNRSMEGLSWLTLVRNLYKRKGALMGENVPELVDAAV